MLLSWPSGCQTEIRLRRDQWYGLSQKLNFLKKPFIRGVLVLIETMANGIVSLNYSANQAMEEENGKKASEKIDFSVPSFNRAKLYFGIGFLSCCRTFYLTN